VEFGGVVEEGWFTVDFTVEELRTLRAREPMPDLRPHTLDGRTDWTIPTLDEILALRAEVSAERGWELGVVPEIKHSSLFHVLGHDPEAALLAALERAGVSDSGPLVRIESFELGNLVRLRRELGWGGTLVFLAEDSGRPLDHVLTGDPRTYADLLTRASLERLAQTVDAIGPSKHLVIGRTAEGRLAEPTSLVADAHDAGLEVTPWTFRAENHFLPADLRIGSDPARHGDYAAELTAYFDAGVDAVFCDQPADAVRVRDAYLASRT
jgi:glycerophosphoryl diester phosphodiesterase